MKQTLEQTQAIRTIIDKVVFIILSTILLVILSLVIWQVVSRYALGDPSVFTEELVRFLLLWLGCLSAIYAFGQHRHIALTYLFDKLSKPLQKNIVLVHYIITLLFALLFFLYGGLQLMNITTMQTSSVLAIPMHYVFIIFPFCGIILVFYKTLDIMDLFSTDENSME